MAESSAFTWLCEQTSTIAERVLPYELTSRSVVSLPHGYGRGGLGTW